MTLPYITITDANKKCRFTNSKYNERRNQFNDALAIIQATMKAQVKEPVNTIGELSLDSLQMHNDKTTFVSDLFLT